ncbi:unnamed protein product [Prorocentrum cordatum]|uniref:Uncharacterized protein n=1 Tax=Prorocentrum cordatum TaxID=2364126 RepID=A0ABN9U165_9DINO|nr:unnamed protein product [Polarella glacialis]
MFVFFGSLVMGGAVNSFMRWNDPDIRMAAHRMLSVSVSIFCAMTIFKMIEGFVFNQIVAGDPPRGLGIKELSHETHLGIDMALFPCFLASISWCCRSTYQNLKELHTWFNVAKLLVPHLAGFCGFVLSDSLIAVVLDYFSDGQSHDALFIIMILGLVLMIRLLCWLLHILRKRPWYSEEGVIDDAEEDGNDSPRTPAERHLHHLHECTEVIEEGEDDVTAFVLSGAMYSYLHYLTLSRPGVGCSEYAICFHLVPSRLPVTCVPDAVVSSWIHYPARWRIPGLQWLPSSSRPVPAGELGVAY